MPTEYVLDFAEDMAPTAVDERALEQFYATTAPAGAPPLEDVRDHVISAFARTTALSPPPPPDLRLLSTLDDFLPTKISELATARYWSASDAVAHLSAVRATIGLIQVDDLRAQLDEQLLAACSVIASSGASVRLVERDRVVSFDEQLAVLASAGVTPRAGTTREQLTYNYSEDEWANEPYHLLADLIEQSDQMYDLAAKCLEDPDDDADIYARIVTRLAKLTDLPITNVESHADFTAETVTLSFDLDGTTHRPKLEWRGEYVDYDVILEVDKLARPRGRGLYILPPDSEESFTLLVTDDAGYLRLRAAGAPFRPVSSPP